MKIKADNNDYKLLLSTIDKWMKHGNISPEKAHELKSTIDVPKTAGQQIAQYFFFIALSCILLAFGAIFIDDKFLEKLKQYFALTNLFIALLFTALCILWFVLLRKKKHSTNTLPYEIYTIIGSLLLVTAITYYCKETGFGPKHSGFLAACSVFILLLSVWMRSYAMWVAGILAFMGWFGAFSTWLSSHDLFLGINYPVRFALFGLLVTSFAWWQQRLPILHYSHRLHISQGLLYYLQHCGACLYSVITIVLNSGQLSGKHRLSCTHFCLLLLALQHSSLVSNTKTMQPEMWV